jgi:hypothetical protein
MVALYIDGSDSEGGKPVIASLARGTVGSACGAQRGEQRPAADPDGHAEAGSTRGTAHGDLGTGRPDRGGHQGEGRVPDGKDSCNDDKNHSARVRSDRV